MNLQQFLEIKSRHLTWVGPNSIFAITSTIHLLSYLRISKYICTIWNRGMYVVCSITIFVKRYSTIHCHFSVSNFLQSRKKVILFYDKWKRNNIQRMSIWAESLLFFKIFWNHIISVIFSQVLLHLSTFFSLYLYSKIYMPYPLQNKDGVSFFKIDYWVGLKFRYPSKSGVLFKKNTKNITFHI